MIDEVPETRLDTVRSRCGLRAGAYKVAEVDSTDLDVGHPVSIADR
jgi:hypothetical protein